MTPEQQARHYGIALNGVSFMGMMLDHGEHIGPEFFPGDSFKERWIPVTDHAAALEQARREGRTEMHAQLVDCVRSLRYMRRGTKAEMLKLLDTLLSSPEAGDRYRQMQIQEVQRKAWIRGIRESPLLGNYLTDELLEAEAGRRWPMSESKEVPK